MLLIHQSPMGDLEIPTVLGVVPAGEPFEVDDDIAESLLEQGDVFAPAPANTAPPAPTPTTAVVASVPPANVSLAPASSKPAPDTGSPAVPDTNTTVSDTSEPATGADTQEVQA